MVDSLNYRELQSVLRSKGLPSSGNTATLRQRLREVAKPIVAPAEPAFKDLCLSDTDNCQNVGGRCYFMAVMTFLMKANSELQAAGVVSPVIAKVMEFAAEMTACKKVRQRVEKCRQLPTPINATYQKYLDYLGKTKAPNNVVRVGGSSNLLLRAVLSYAVGGFEHVPIFPKTVDGAKIWAPLVLTPKNKGTLVIEWGGAHNLPKTPNQRFSAESVKQELLKRADEIVAAAAPNTIKVLGGVVSLGTTTGDQHAVSFNLCGPERKIVWCDPNVMRCFILEESSRWKGVQLFFARKYEFIDMISWVAVWV